MKRAPVFVFQRILGAMQAAGRQPPHMLPASLFNAFKSVAGCSVAVHVFGGCGWGTDVRQGSGSWVYEYLSKHALHGRACMCVQVGGEQEGGVGIWQMGPGHVRQLPQAGPPRSPAGKRERLLERSLRQP